MSAAHKNECPGGAGQVAMQNDNDLDFATGNRRSKEEPDLCTILALAGHCVHQLRDGGYLVAKYGYSYLADDIIDLQAFAVRLGGCHA